MAGKEAQDDEIDIESAVRVVPSGRRMTVLTARCGIALWTDVESACLQTAYNNLYHPGIGECGGGSRG